MSSLLRQQKAMSAYGAASQTIPVSRQIVLLYDGAIRKVEEARQASLEQRIEDRFNATQKAAQIIDALHASLDFEQGGEVAQTLDRWYTMIGMKIQRLNVTNSEADCHEVIALLREVRNAWDRITSAPASPAAAPPDPARVAASLTT